MNQAPKRPAKDPFVRLAERAIRAFVEQAVTVAPPEEPGKDLATPAAVFVSIKKQGALRGCIGTLAPTTSTAAEETIANAIRAATRDPRFSAVTKNELDDLTISVDVLTTPEACTPQDLDPAIYGVIVESGLRRGLLLPALEGVNTVDDQIAIARRKAGITPEDPIRLQRFSVERHV